uniref:Signal transduction histidine kinase n=1 Tax=Cyanothece sp. (strain PCC 7425 / ATCC 29141) TaxID=395961 RepID=B8HYR2_CYAP4
MVLSPHKILIIDDSPEDRELYRKYLKSGLDGSWHCLEADLAERGLELWDQHRPDLIFLDDALPDLNSLEFLARLSSLIPRSHVPVCLPVIVFANQGNAATAVQVMKAGAQDYLVKEQVTPEVLHASVDRAMATIQLHTELDQRIERERLCTQLTRKIHNSLELEKILQTTVTEVRQFLQTDRILIFRLESDGWGKVSTESVGADWTALLSTSYYDPCFNETYADFFRQGLITLKPDIQDGSIAPCHVELLSNLEVRSNLVVPINTNTQLWGLLIAHHCAAPRQWQPVEVELLQELATHLGIAIQQSALYQNSQQELAARKQAETIQQHRAERERALQLITLLIHQSLNLDETLTTTLHQVRTNMRADRVAVYRFEPDWSGQFVAESKGEAWIPLVGPHIQRVWEDTYLQATAGGRYQNHETFILNDVYTAGLTPCHLELLEQFQAKAHAIVPIFVQNRLWGLLAAYQNSAPREWQVEEVELLEQIAVRMAIAIHQADLYQQLQLQLQERTQAEAKLKKSLREKELLLKEIHHRVKNNLTVVSSLLNLQSETTQDALALKLLQESQDRIATIALVHELLYQSPSLERIEVDQYLKRLTEQIFSTYSSQHLRLHLDLDAVSLNIETALPCGLIVNELLSNALKHAFPSHETGDIWISFKLEKKHYCLIVRDNGIGLPEGLNLSQSPSLGLQVVSDLTRQLRGTIMLSQGENPAQRGSGACFRVVFQELYYRKRV